MIRVAKRCGADVVKFQKRTLSICYTEQELMQPRPGPWGSLNGDLKRLLEFDAFQYDEIDDLCESKGIDWTASPWDVPSLDFLQQYRLRYMKLASPCITDENLVGRMRNGSSQVIMSTGMSTPEEIQQTIVGLGDSLWGLLHCTSTYPCQINELNLACIPRMAKYGAPRVGFSSHSTSPWPALMAVAMGATIIEAHLTLDRTMWGSDQAASLEPDAFAKLVTEIRTFETARGDGNKRVYDSELSSRAKLRRYTAPWPVSVPEHHE